ncbi:uncharacterized protein A1O5_00797 [Cladophialophora psammophila CBS 110553]|uniref:ABM domain-containing protein n=1 Tax=Cladophialophora psammophila CBS 110553 TaxID=1182543 RepID=W9Y1C7_9EURO|nr:uncharacterized protein A1O5_00797 [Cladophialophora psammophila CBS 110553]EXJ76289.1 hypothetical protein A1O5_00797 [Cladophialophora psammophila CBS 110553]
MSAHAFIAEIFSSAGEGQEAILEAIRGVNKQVIQNEPNASVYYWYTPEEANGGTAIGLRTFLNLVDTIGKACPGEPKLSIENLAQVAGFTEREAPQSAGLVVVARFVVELESQDRILKLLQKYAGFVQQSEPETLTFVVYQSRERPGEIVVFQRFVSRSSFEQQHSQTPEPKKLENDPSSHIKNADVRTYKEAGIGFLKRQ